MNEQFPGKFKMQFVELFMVSHAFPIECGWQWWHLTTNMCLTATTTNITEKFHASETNLIMFLVQNCQKQNWMTIIYKKC